MNGLHILAELNHCACKPLLLQDANALRKLCIDAVQSAGLGAVGELFYTFEGAGGVTGTILLAESHLAVHTWPELSAITLDAYVCNLTADNSAKANALVNQLVAEFAPLHTAKKLVHRGNLR